MNTDTQADSHIEIYQLQRILQRRYKIAMARYDRKFDKVEHLSRFTRRARAAPNGPR